MFVHSFGEVLVGGCGIETAPLVPEARQKAAAKAGVADAVNDRVDGVHHEHQTHADREHPRRVPHELDPRVFVENPMHVEHMNRHVQQGENRHDHGQRLDRSPAVLQPASSAQTSESVDDLAVDRRDEDQRDEVQEDEIHRLQQLLVERVGPERFTGVDPSLRFVLSARLVGTRAFGDVYLYKVVEDQLRGGEKQGSQPDETGRHLHLGSAHGNSESDLVSFHGDRHQSSKRCVEAKVSRGKDHLAQEQAEGPFELQEIVGQVEWCEDDEDAKVWHGQVHQQQVHGGESSPLPAQHREHDAITN